MPLKTESASFKAFFRAFGGSWVTYMTGPLTIPFAAIAFYVTDEVARVIFGLLAVSCFGISAYVIWKNERIGRIAIEEKLDALNTPSVSIALHQIDEGLENMQRLFLEVTGVGIEYVRPEVFAVSVEGIGEGKHPVFCAPGIASPFGVRRGETHNIAAVIYDLRHSLPLRVVLPCKKLTSSDYPQGDYYRMKIHAYAGPKEAELNIEFGMEGPALWARLVGSSERLFSDLRAIAMKGKT